MYHIYFSCMNIYQKFHIKIMSMICKLGRFMSFMNMQISYRQTTEVNLEKTMCIHNVITIYPILNKFNKTSHYLLLDALLLTTSTNFRYNIYIYMYINWIHAISDMQRNMLISRNKYIKISIHHTCTLTIHESLSQYEEIFSLYIIKSNNSLFMQTVACNLAINWIYYMQISYWICKWLHTHTLK